MINGAAGSVVSNGWVVHHHEMVPDSHGRVTRKGNERLDFAGGSDGGGIETGRVSLGEVTVEASGGRMLT